MTDSTFCPMEQWVSLAGMSCTALITSDAYCVVQWRYAGLTVNVVGPVVAAS